jgi:hypothetical protein
MASKAAQGSKKIIARVHRACEIRGCSIDELFWFAGRQARVKDKHILDHIGLFHMALQGIGFANPPMYLRTVVNQIRKEEHLRSKRNAKSIVARSGDVPAARRSVVTHSLDRDNARGVKRPRHDHEHKVRGVPAFGPTPSTSHHV